MLETKTWLRQWREREGFTQDEMADRVGVSRNRWSEIENADESLPGLETAIAIETFIGIAPRDFFNTTPLGRKHKRKED